MANPVLVVPCFVIGVHSRTFENLLEPSTLIFYNLILFKENNVKTRVAIMSVLGFFALCQILPAAIIVSTFSSVPPGYVGDGFAMSFSVTTFITQSTHWAMGFTVPAGSDFQLTDLRAALAFPTGASTVDFTLTSAKADFTPGTPIETISISGSSNTAALYAGSSLIQPVLLAGRAYWLDAAVSPSRPNTEADWNLAAPSGLNLGPVGFRAVGPFDHNWSLSIHTQGAFELDGVALPEPSTGSTFLVLGVLLSIGRLFRRSQTRFH